MSAPFCRSPVLRADPARTGDVSTGPALTMVLQLQRVSTETSSFPHYSNMFEPRTLTCTDPDCRNRLARLQARLLGPQDPSREGRSACDGRSLWTRVHRRPRRDLTGTVVQSDYSARPYGQKRALRARSEEEKRTVSHVIPSAPREPHTTDKPSSKRRCRPGPRPAARTGLLRTSNRARDPLRQASRQGGCTSILAAALLLLAWLVDPSVFPLSAVVDVVDVRITS
jgi:hypothetical protein